jgi:hypothetical protein
MSFLRDTRITAMFFLLKGCAMEQPPIDGSRPKRAGGERQAWATQSGIGRLTRGLLVVVLGEAIYPAEFARLRRGGHPTGRLSVYVAVDPPVDQPGIPHAIVQRQPQLPT